MPEIQETDLGDEEIEAAHLKGSEIFDELMESFEEDEIEEDAIGVCYSLWIEFTRFLVEAGWTAEELTKDVCYHAADLTTEGKG